MHYHRGFGSGEENCGEDVDGIKIKGFVTFSFQYRLSGNEDGSYPHPDITPVESTKDARSAIRWSRN